VSGRWTREPGKARRTSGWPFGSRRRPARQPARPPASAASPTSAGSPVTSGFSEERGLTPEDPQGSAQARETLGGPASEVLPSVSRETDSLEALEQPASEPSAATPIPVQHVVSRETDPPAPLDPPTIRGRATHHLKEETTPLASAVEYSLMLRHELAQRIPMARPAHTRVMVVANQKGGVGKTTTTVNLAATMAQHGLRVMVIDLDPQGNASTALAIDHRRGTPSTYDALVEGRPLAEVVQPAQEAPGLLVVPATIDLAGAEIELVSVVARENRLRKAIHGHPDVNAEGEERIDYVLIDCPPSLGLLTLNALVAADELLLPIQAEYYALEGVGQLLETVELVRANLNPALRISTVLLTMYDARTRLSAGVADEVRSHFGDRVLRTAIPRSVRVSEAPSYGQSVMSYDPASPGALSYLEAARELTNKGAGLDPDAATGAGPTGSAGEDDLPGSGDAEAGAAHQPEPETTARQTEGVHS
jgi:chromosome partitioning protein